MNERINELAVQAFRDTALYGGKRGDKDFDQRYNEKFAELIIREAADIATINAHQWHSPGRFVLTHFGIE